MPPDSADAEGLQRAFEALQAAHPELEPLAVLVLLAMRHQAASGRPSSNTALLAQRLDTEHAFIRRAAADLEAGGWITSVPVGGASPALRLVLVTDLSSRPPDLPGDQ